MSTKLRTLLAVSSLALVCAVYGPPVFAQTGSEQPTAQPAQENQPQGEEQPAPEAQGQEQAPAEATQGQEQPAADEAQGQDQQQPPADAGQGQEQQPAAEAAQGQDQQPAAEAAQAPAEEKPAEEVKVSPSDPAPENAKKAVADIPQPDNDIEKAALAVLEKHCARCHQEGKLEDRVKPAKGFGNILHLKEIANQPSLILAGNPDGSQLLKQIASGNMPYDIKDGSNLFAPTPTKEEISALRTWIGSLKDTLTAACANRQFVANDGMISAIADDLDKEPDHRVKGMRYITLTHLYNACSTDTEMKVYRQAVIKLLNSLSTNSDLLTLQTADTGQTIIKFNLDDLNWTEADWERIVKSYPYAIKPDVQKFSYVTDKVGTKVPYVRGDWLAFTAARPPLYHDLLKLPKTFAELQKAVTVDVDQNIEKFLAKRAGSQQSLVSQNNRLIERHSISTGHFWTSYDFKANSGTKSLFEHPLGPKGENAFEADGGETIYSLPNGLNAYYLNKSDGTQIDKGPTDIVRDPDRKDLAVTNGISCMGCHDQGIRLYSDQIRQHVINDRNFPKSVREKVEALYPPQEEIDKVLKQDTEHFQGAMRKAGLDPSLKFEGVEMINALSNRYEKDVHLQLAAAEFGLNAETFEKAASDSGGDANTLLRRLKQAVVPRDNFETLFGKLVAEVTDDEAATPEAAATAEAVAQAEVAKPNQGDAKIEGKTALTLISDKTDYALNELPVFIVQSDTDCNLTLINVDSAGTGTVLLPNKFQQDSLIKANEAVEFPAKDAPFQFRLKDPGVETVIALCNAKAGTRSVDNITHDFNKQAFTDLGEYEKFVTRAIAVEQATIKKEAEAKVAEKTDTAAPEKVENIASRTGVARSAIKLTVK